MGVVATMTLSGATIFTLLLYLVVVILTIISVDPDSTKGGVQ